MDTTTPRTIASQNDCLRAALPVGTAAVPGCVVLTRALAALPSATVARVLQAVATFTDFSDGNDPYGEHDFGALDVDGARINFKIDYYADAALVAGAEDARTSYRVLTIMLAEDY
jgi:hypothetical protein